MDAEFMIHTLKSVGPLALCVRGQKQRNWKTEKQRGEKKKKKKYVRLESTASPLKKQKKKKKA